MASKKHLQIAYSAAIILFVIGAFSYAAFSAKKPEHPVRLMFKGIAGKVLFDHKIHASGTGYGAACNDCHHHPAGQASGYRPCSDCHLSEGNNTGTQPESCKECHDPGDYEGVEILKKTEAFHTQCINCHKQIGAGPQECSACHVM